jgi:toxin-antitoxin system PIN domain toxin
VILLDANILLYAWNADAPQHTAARRWVEELFASDQTIAIPWQTIWAFVRIATNPRLSAPVPVETVFGIVDEWLARPNVMTVAPGSRHRHIAERLAIEHKVRGPMITDAVLAALAIENGASLASTDHDFSRFTGLRWINPLAPKQR